jgi:hypothetical protein
MRVLLRRLWTEEKGQDILRIGRFRSLDRALLAEAAPVLPDHAHLFPTETCVLDRHAEERVFILLVICGKGVLVK